MNKQKAYIIYALKSEVNGILYVGFTKDIDRRVKEHNSGKTKFTKGYLPRKLVYTETAYSRETARKISKEWSWKRMAQE